MCVRIGWDMKFRSQRGQDTDDSSIFVIDQQPLWRIAVFPEIRQ